jgi:hypothetical protein
MATTENDLAIVYVDNVAVDAQGGALSSSETASSSLPRTILSELSHQ